MSVRILFLFISSTLANAADWPTYGGLHKNHISLEDTLRTDWGEEEPKKLWSFDVGIGYSSIVEANGRAFGHGYHNGKNILFCINAETGKEIWTHQYPCQKAPDYFQGGTRSTPTVDGGIVFLQSHEGDLYSIEAKTGKILWSLNIVDDLQGVRPQWGFAGSPLVTNDKVIIQTGSPSGSLVALDRENGRVLWRSGKDDAGYASLYLRKSNPKEIVVFNQFGLVLKNEIDGSEICRYQHKTRYGINAAQPLEFKNSFLISSAYGKGAAFVTHQNSRMQSIWESEAMSCQMASLVRWQDYAFGIHGQAGTRANQSTLFCVDISKGRKKWEKTGFGVGTLILVKDNLVILSDQGSLTIAKANAQKFVELESFQILSGKNNWTPPTYSNGRMHCRSSEGKWVCLAMSK